MKEQEETNELSGETCGGYAKPTGSPRPGEVGDWVCIDDSWQWIPDIGG